MPINITVDQAVTWGANQMPAVKQAAEPEKGRIIPITKYNLLATAFNASTVLMTIAIASAVFFAYTTAFVFGAAAIFIRLTTSQELNKYTLPEDPQDRARQRWAGVRAAALDPMAYVGAQLRHLVNQAPQREREDNIFQRLGVQKPEVWNENEVFIFDHPVWKNRIPEAAPRLEQAVAAPAPGLRGLVAQVVAAAGDVPVAAPEAPAAAPVAPLAGD